MVYFLAVGSGLVALGVLFDLWWWYGTMGDTRLVPAVGMVTISAILGAVLLVLVGAGVGGW